MAKEWISHGSMTVTSNTTELQAPNASNTAAKVTRSNAEGYIYRINETTCEADKDYVVSIFLKLSSVERGVLRVGGSLTDNFVEATYDLVNNRIVNGPKGKGNLVSGFGARLFAIGDDWKVLLLGCRFYEDTDVNIYFTTRDGDVGLTGADTTGTSQVGYFWNPKVERRSLDPSVGLFTNPYIDFHNVPERTFTHIPVWGSDTNVISYKKDDNTIRSIQPTPLTDFQTNTAVEYVRIPITAKDGFPDKYIVEDNLGNIREMDLEKSDIYSKYEPHLVSYVNKNGVLDSIWFARRSDYSINSRSEMYYDNLIDYDTMSIDTAGHSERKYNIIAQKEVKLNTDFVPEEMNLQFEELKLSEQVWVSNSIGTFPVNLLDGKMRYKTHVNDKLIQYELTFKFANRVDNVIV